MNTRKFLTLLAVGIAMPALAQNSIDNPMTKAVLGVYAMQLQQDPTDWDTWMRRANEYYNHSEYMRALFDIDNALKYIPESRKAEREQAYQLRANIYEQTGRHEDALQNLNSALALNPDSYIALYQRANTLYELGRYTEAKADYRRLQRLNPRSVESLIGQARIAVLENNLGLANELLDQAVSLDPNNADYYVRRSSVRKSMGNDSGAVEDLLLALSTDSGNERATSALVEYGKTNYAAVIAGLTSAMTSAPRVGMFVYLRAVIAQAHFNYTAALADFQRIIDQNLYDYHGIYASMAECYYALCQFDKALESVEHAISMDNTVPARYILRSKILRALGQYDEAVKSATHASVLTRNNIPAIVELGLCYMSKKNYVAAADLFGEATINDPESPANFILRAWVLNDFLNKPVAAKGFYTHITEMEGLDASNPLTLVGFARYYAGDTEGASRWIAEITAPREGADAPEALASYLAACLAANMGDNDAALAHAEAALRAGYANRYDWTVNTDARISIAPLREDPRFNALLDRYKHIFGE